MPTKPRAFRFSGKPTHSTVIGERVVLQVPLAPQHCGPTQSVPIRSFLKHVEAQILSLYDKYGDDIDGFALHLEKGLPTAITFTRPMDILELTEIRAARAREQAQRDDQITQEQQPAPQAQAHEPSPSSYSHLLAPPTETPAAPAAEAVRGAPAL